MQPKTEEFLYSLLWAFDTALNPTFRNLHSSYEGWLYRNGFGRQLASLERKGYIEAKSGLKDRGDRIYRLTERGRLHALGGRDPRERWARKWDGRWRLVLFDIPEEARRERRELRRYLRSRSFGNLQNSVWITPDPVEAERTLLRGGRVNAESLVVLEARPAAGEEDLDLVLGAWDFEAISREYRRHLAVLRSRPQAPVRSAAEARALRKWGRAERSAWLAASASDPFLPRCLWPPGYLGEKVWTQRLSALRAASRQIADFRSED